MADTADATKRTHRDDMHAINASDVHFEFERKDPEAGTGRLWLRQFASATRRSVIPSWTTEIPRCLRPGFPPTQLGPMSKPLRYLGHSRAARAAVH
ncbi:hypothetical protein AB0L63_20695 [Nocardia sp. NPDC051990]|uniref:hypothetical protein n=1 Tax=Nocardia sp. NPDC051990 TaxID=3155285 RepID=UPI0034442E18